MSDTCCKECNNSLIWADPEQPEVTYGAHAAEEHPDQCCDCFDEGYGMPAHQRSRPRGD